MGSLGHVDADWQPGPFVADAVRRFRGAAVASHSGRNSHRSCYTFVRMHTREKAHAYVCTSIEHIFLQEYCGMTRTSTPMNTSASLASSQST